MKRTKQKQKGLSGEFNRVRLGFAIGAAAIIAATAFMNISGWVAMAGTPAQALANGVLSGGLEIMAVSAFALSGHQASKGRWGRAAALALAGAAVIYFNTFATQNFIHVQEDTLVNAIETDAATVGVVGDQIAAIDREIESIIAQNDGVPRDVETIERAYSSLDPEENPINMMRKESEIGDRLRYEQLMAQREELMRSSTDAVVGANDEARSVIPEEQLPFFVWTMEIIKASAAFMLGTSKVVPFWDKKGQAAQANRRKWAIIKNRYSRKNALEIA